ncbi:MAG: FAD binding domain-containing protein [Candidatus Dormibacteraeota bacterium]|nr:FAD binding domain-containing protein [Candidatus Dormibacteraeota bacterium]
MTAAFAYRSPVERQELFSLLVEHGENARILAGGTDLLIDVRAGFAHPALVVNIKRVEGFSDITWSQTEGLIIRPGVTINDVLADARIRDSYPLLVACAQVLASHQIRNRATVIGNVVNASPCSDMAPALLCLGARAVISSATGQRVVPFKEFFTGVKRTVLRPDEILEEIIVPPETAAARGSYCKLKRIKGHDLGIVGVAAMSKDGVLNLGISSCAPTPLLVEGLSAADSADAVVAAARDAIHPIDDLRCSREYREHMVGIFARRVLQEVA